jgi:hypothetical protein
MTNREAYTFITILSNLQVQKGTKLEHARNQTLKNATAFIEAYNAKLEDLNIDFCSTDERGNILRDEAGRYHFTKQGQRMLLVELKKFLDSEQLIEFSISSTSYRNGLNEDHIDYLQHVSFLREDITMAIL